MWRPGGGGERGERGGAGRNAWGLCPLKRRRRQRQGSSSIECAQLEPGNVQGCSCHSVSATVSVPQQPHHQPHTPSHSLTHRRLLTHRLATRERHESRCLLPSRPLLPSMDNSAANIMESNLSGQQQQHFLQPACFFPQNVQLSPAEEHEAAKPKQIKRQRSSSPELMRCKRRLNFTGFGYSLPQQQPAAVARRNERERNRVKLVNLGFATLREHVPNGAANKKMSKVETLRSAVEYIRALQQLLDEHDAVSAAFQSGVLSPTISPNYSHDMNSMAGSPVSSYSSDEGSYDPLSPEEQELLDFTTWF